MEKISDRLIKIVNHEGVSVRSLEGRIGCSNGVLAKSMARGTDISGIWLSKIIEVLPQYSAEWLLTGKGDMLTHSDYNKFQNSFQESAIIEGTGDTLCEMCKMKDKLIISQDKQIETLSKLINHLEEKIRTT